MPNRVDRSKRAPKFDAVLSSQSAELNTRVMIVDDHELVRDGLRQLISRQPRLEVCGEADNEQEARRCFRKLQPDLVVVDLTLQESGGLQLIEWMIAQRPQTKVVVSTMHDERDYGERSIRAGASGYVNKQSPARTILTAIRQVLAGHLFFSNDLTERLMHRAVSRSKAVADSGRPTDSVISALSNRELQVFTLIGQGCTTHEIAQQLHISPNTIGTHRERLKVKLNLASSIELNRQATLWVAEGG